MIQYDQIGNVNRKGLHGQLIASLVEHHPEVRVKGMWDCLKAHPDMEYTADLLSTDRDWKNGIRFIPDAWAIDDEARILFVFEIVVTHDVSDRKFGRMNNLAWALDEDCWTLALTRITDHEASAYDVRLASIAADARAAEMGLRLHGYEVPNWKWYTVERCATIPVPEILL